MTRALGLGLIYFSLVFAAGFVLGTVRVLLLEPRLGARTAELIEIPVMLVVIYCAAKFVVARLPADQARSSGTITGLTGLALLLIFEFSLVTGLRGMTIAQYLESRDPLALTAYLASLLVYAAMPGLLATRKFRRPT